MRTMEEITKEAREITERLTSRAEDRRRAKKALLAGYRAHRVKREEIKDLRAEAEALASRAEPLRVEAELSPLDLPFAPQRAEAPAAGVVAGDFAPAPPLVVLAPIVSDAPAILASAPEIEAIIETTAFVLGDESDL